MKRVPQTFVSLDSHLRSTNLRDLRLSHTIAQNLAQVVTRLHLANYTLGDVSANNFLVDPRGNVSSIDVDSFGFPRLRKGFRLPTAATRHFIPANGRLDQSSDEFALGCIVLWLLVGLHPFGGRRIGSTSDSIQDNINAGTSWLNTPNAFNLPKFMRGHAGIDGLPPVLRSHARRVAGGGTGPSAAIWSDDLRKAALHKCSCRSWSFADAPCPGEAHRMPTIPPLNRPHPVIPPDAFIKPPVTPSPPVTTPKTPPASHKTSYSTPSAQSYSSTRPTAGRPVSVSNKSTNGAERRLRNTAFWSGVVAIFMLLAFGIAARFSDLGPLWWIALVLAGSISAYGASGERSP